MLTRIKNKVIAFQTNSSENLFLRNLGWLGASEAFVRITRLVTAVVLARVMDPLLFGIAALVLTINELIRVFNRNGIGAKIVQCSDDELPAVTNTAYRLNFIFCISLFVMQCAAAYPLAQFYDTPELVPMLQALSLTYLLMPFGMVQASLVQRQQRLKTVALIDGAQVGVDNVITALLAISGLGAWAIVLPKFLTSPIWVFAYRHAFHWQPTGPFLSFCRTQSTLHAKPKANCLSGRTINIITSRLSIYLCSYRVWRSMGQCGASAHPTLLIGITKAFGRQRIGANVSNGAHRSGFQMEHAIYSRFYYHCKHRGALQPLRGRQHNLNYLHGQSPTLFSVRMETSIH